MKVSIYPCLSCLRNRYRSSFSVGGNISRYRANAIDWVALAIVGKIFALEFITHSAGGEGRKGEGRIKCAWNSWLRVEMDLFGHSIFILAPWRLCRPSLRAATLTRENAYARFRRLANDVSCNKSGEMAEKTTVTSGIVGTDVTRIWTGNAALLRQQLRTYAICLTRRRKRGFPMT